MMLEEKIKLLSGKEVSVDETLKQMMDDEYYYGFLGKESLSSSSCKLLLDSPKQYYNSISGASKNTQSLRDGRVFHTMVLEPEMVSKRYYLMDIGSRNTKAYKEKKATEDREIILQKEWNSLSWLESQLTSIDEARELLSGGLAEQPMIGDIFGVPFRGKADYLKPDQIVDLKTTMEIGDIENGKGWIWVAKNKWHYDMQAYIYTTLFNVSKFTFLLVEKGSGDVAIVECSDEFINSGRLKVKFAVESYIKYFVEGEFNPSKYVKRATI